MTTCFFVFIFLLKWKKNYMWITENFFKQSKLKERLTLSLWKWGVIFHLEIKFLLWGQSANKSRWNVILSKWDILNIIQNLQRNVRREQVIIADVFLSFDKTTLIVF